MKKTILAMILAGTSCAAFAQIDSMNRTNSNGSWNNSGMGDSSSMGTLGNGTLNSNNSYNAYGTFNAMAPDYVSSYVLRDYPMATDLHWQQSADWWHGYYLNNGQPMHVYYNSAGQTFTTALPVRQNLIPDDVVSKATAMWGPTLYDITTIKGGNGQDVYLVRTLENGTLNSNWIGQDGSKVVDVYRVENTDPMMSTGNNAAMGSNMNSNMSTNGSTNINTTTNSTNTQSNSSSTRKTNTINDADGVMSNTSTTGGQTNDKAQSDDSATGQASGVNSGTMTTTTTTDSTGTAMSATTGKSGNDKMKIKTRTPDGKKKVTKVVNGKVTTKGQ